MKFRLDNTINGKKTPTNWIGISSRAETPLISNKLLWACQIGTSTRATQYLNSTQLNPTSQDHRLSPLHRPTYKHTITAPPALNTTTSSNKLFYFLFFFLLFPSSPRGCSWTWRELPSNASKEEHDTTCATITRPKGLGINLGSKIGARKRSGLMDASKKENGARRRRRHRPIEWARLSPPPSFLEHNPSQEYALVVQQEPPASSLSTDGVRGRPRYHQMPPHAV